MTCCGCKRTLTTSPFHGPQLDFDPGDFSPGDLQRTRGSWNDPTNNRDVLHTYRPEIPEGCEVAGGVLRVAVKRERLDDFSHNDNYQLTHSGGQRLHTEQVWVGDYAAAFERTIVIELDNGMVDAINNGGTLSFLITDDTTALWTDLVLELCCHGAFASVTGLNSCKSEVVETDPWGPTTVPIYSETDLVVISTAGTCLDGDGYFIALDEFDPVAWQSVDSLFSGWITHRGPVPDLIDLAEFLAPHRRSPLGGFWPGKYYSLQLAVGSPWQAAHFHFKVV